MSHIDLNRLIEALEPDLRVTLEAAASVAVRRGTGTWISRIGCWRL